MRTTLEETERNNQIILDAAVRVFSAKGYEAANMQDIADAAGITRGPLYYRYKTKLDLFQAALLVNCERDFEEYKRIFAQDKGIWDIIREDMVFCTKSLQMNTYTFDSIIADTPALRKSYEVMRKYTRKIFDVKVDAVKEAMQKKELKPGTDPRQIVNLMFIFAEGLYSTVQRSKIVFSRKEVTDAIEDLIYLLKNRYGADS
ncbi:TetR/AcrR family transcriptional regulator [Caproiciproducens sp.]